MSSLKRDIGTFYQRDLDRLIDNLKETPEEDLWRVPEGVSNSCGMLVQHLVGNLNHFIGKGLGKTGYVRQRDHEFTATKKPKEELIQSVQELKVTLDRVFDAIADDNFDEGFPMDLPFEASTGGFLVHLYGHLNYHLGQINYLRRIKSDD